MLKEIYITFGGVGAFFVAIGMCLIALAWLLAITGTVTRSMTQWKKVSLVFLLSVMPPVSIGVLIAFLVNDRRISTVVALPTSPTSNAIPQRAA